MTELKVSERWQQIPSLTHSKAFIKCPMEQRKTDRLLEFSRTNLKTLVGLYTGHCKLNRHMFRLGLSQTEECRLCMEDDETAEHILCNCPAAGRIRHQVFGRPTLQARDLKDTSPDRIISFARMLDLLGEI